MRVTQQMLYANVLTQMNSTLSQLMESNVQASSQKRINKPSDDPIGMVQVLDSRTTLGNITQYQSNITQAKGWLTLADSTMTSVSTILTSLEGMAEQGATGTVNSSNRQEISYQARQYFEQLISLANTQFNGNSLFAGHKIGNPAFTETLWMTSNDANLSNASFAINGGTDTTVMVQFSNAGLLSTHPAFRYSNDGGQTWQTGSYAAPDPSAGKVRLNLGTGLSLDLDSSKTVKASANTNDGNGTWLWIRPTAQYQGDDQDAVEVDPQNNTQVKGRAGGTFSGSVMVRVDQQVNLASNGTFGYSYSVDGGRTWVVSNSSGTITGSNATLILPGGQLVLSNAGGSTINAGDEFFIRPRAALINVNITQFDSVVINGIGKDIFGGVYKDPAASNAGVVSINGKITTNMFETVGKLVASLETNNQAGCQQALAELQDTSQVVLGYAANVGSRENRLTTAGNVLDTLQTNTTQTLSDVEDVDLAALMTKLAQQELAYQSVLKSSSMVMQLSLVNYI